MILETYLQKPVDKHLSHPSSALNAQLESPFVVRPGVGGGGRRVLTR
jgi:hypothetical protein